MVSLDSYKKGEIPGDATLLDCLSDMLTVLTSIFTTTKKNFFNLIKFQNKWGKFGNRHRHTQKTVGGTEKKMLFTAITWNKMVFN